LFFIQGGFMKTLIVMLSVIMLGSVSYGRPNRHYNYSQPNIAPSKTYSYANVTNSSDQERCQAEANYMAANKISGHVWGCIGNFEGVGYGSSPNCNTCTPSNNMNLTGDASAQDNNGRWYRVRSWR
jgi:hypothetical protein